ncbi:hypothetical protein ED388_04480 [Muribaculaceae bacterium Isolate-007 (NCI)]|nr:hypothetical protein EEL42_03205 [Muribaculaceae bacterium Isolate-100 (HZI)]RXE66245.1 hypothetical protein ED388_04480 [Muribaculaceae bacterium Isolate-007 (NCI)]
MKNLSYSLCIMCLMLASCSSDEPDIVQADTWIVEYAASFTSVKPENQQSFLRWCETHEDLIQYTIPSQDLCSFSYKSASVLKWTEITTSEIEAKQKVNDFNSIIGDNSLTTHGANYRKCEPQFNGPWGITFVEMFYLMHNNSDNFNKWYDENLSNLRSSSFLLSTTSFQWEYPSAQSAFSFYGKSLCGNLQWYVEIPKASELEIQYLVKHFQSFSIVNNTKDGYDTFVADYSPITPSKIFP